jgi:hypothetical protein
MRTASVTGQDLAYWVARANMHGSPQKHNILRRHYGESPSTHEPCDEASMRKFVAAKLGDTLPPRAAWQ